MLQKHLTMVERVMLNNQTGNGRNQRPAQYPKTTFFSMQKFIEYTVPKNTRRNTDNKLNKPGPAQVGAISKVQK